MKAVYIGSGAAWFVVALYVLFVQGEVASVLPFGTTFALLVLASVTPRKEVNRETPFTLMLSYLPTWREVFFCIVLVTGAITYAVSLGFFIKWCVTVLAGLLLKWISPTLEEDSVAVLLESEQE